MLLLLLPLSTTSKEYLNKLRARKKWKTKIFGSLKSEKIIPKLFFGLKKKRTRDEPRRNKLY